MTEKEAIERIKMILREVTEDEDAVSYVTFYDADATWHNNQSTETSRKN